MTVRQIVYSSDPMLHEPSRTVRGGDADLEELIEDLIDTMRATDGIGLAAVQIGVQQRVIVVEIPVPSEEEEGEPDAPPETELYVLVNPEIVAASDQLVEGVEGCLSVPGWAGEVERHQTVTVEGVDRRGRNLRIEAEGLLARVFQHEIDHCEGVLFIHRIEDSEKIWRVEEGQEEAAERGHTRLSV